MYGYHQNGYSNTYPNAYPNTYPNAASNAPPDISVDNMYSNAYPNAYPNTYPNAYPNYSANGYQNAYGNGTSNTYPNAYPNNYQNAYPNANQNYYPNTYANAYPNNFQNQGNYPTGQYNNGNSSNLSNSNPTSSYDRYSQPAAYQQPHPPPQFNNPPTKPPVQGKKALLIGINYFGTNVQLKGCCNDVKNLKQFLIERYGYSDHPHCMVVLTDDRKDRPQPTRTNILSACEWLVKDAKPGDRLFFHFSGHGSQQEDTDGDEVDGFDETILPLDYKVAGQIVDDLLHDILVKPLKQGVRLTAIFDSCHSGTALDLPYIYQPNRGYKTAGISPMQIGQSFLLAGKEYLGGHKKEALKKFSDVVKLGIKMKAVQKKVEQTKSSPANVVMFAGCQDDQTSADVGGNNFGGASTGAMSFAFMAALKQNSNHTYQSLLETMRDILHEKNLSQIPQMSTSHPMLDANARFEL